MDVWTFPKKTCEPEGASFCIDQPYSFLVNLTILAVLLVLFGRARTLPTRTALLCFIVFEILHAWSHARHIPGRFQLTIIHLIGYTFFLSIGWCLQTRLNVLQKYWRFRYWIISLFVVLFVADVYFFLFGKYPIAQVFTSALILFSLIVICLPLMTNRLRSWWIATLISSVLVFSQIAIEARFCSTWRRRFPRFPFHIIVELLGLCSFTLLGIALLLTEEKKR